MFSYQKNNLAEGACLIIINYKQNIKIGGLRIESSRGFYRKTDITVFGFCLYYKLGGLTYRKDIDYFSEVLSHDSFFTKQAIKELLRFDLFKYINSLIFWSDCRNCFRSQEMMYFIYKEFPNELKFPLASINFFAEYHGKSEVYGHFGGIDQVAK